MDDLLVSINELRKYLWSRVSNGRNNIFYRHEREKIEALIMKTTDESMSSCVLISGSQDNEVLDLIGDVLLNLNRKLLMGATYSVAYIDGLTATDAMRSLLIILHQLENIFPCKESYTLLLESLILRLQEAKVLGKPVILVLNNFDKFASADMRKLLYTLLDYLHSKDMLFQIICVTNKLNAIDHMDKRVVSRMLAQTVSIPPPTETHILEYLHERLYVPIEAACEWNRDRGLLVSLNDHNKRVDLLFGRVANTSADCGEPVKGELFTDVLQLMRKGRGKRLFVNTAKALLLAIPLVEEPEQTSPRPAVAPVDRYLSADLFRAALRSQDIPPLARTLAQLPFHQLLLFAATTRLYAVHKTEVGVTDVDATATSNATTSPRARAITAGRIVDESERMSPVMSKELNNLEGALELLAGLAEMHLLVPLGLDGRPFPYQDQPIRIETWIMLGGISPLEAQLAFEQKEPGGNGYVVKLQDRVRGAVLRPHEPIHALKQL